MVTAAIPRGEKSPRKMQSSILQSWKSTKRIVPETALKKHRGGKRKNSGIWSGTGDGTDYRHAAGTVGDHRTDAGTCYSRIPRRRSVPGSGEVSCVPETGSIFIVWNRRKRNKTGNCCGKMCLSNRCLTGMELQSAVMMGQLRHRE